MVDTVLVPSSTTHTDQGEMITKPRSAASLPTPAAKRRYWITLSAFILMAILFAFGVLAWDNPMPIGSDGFWTIARMRATTLVIIAVVAVAQSIATVSFQTVTNNRIITPSIMGFESLYVAVQTSAVYFLGIGGVIALQGLPQYVLQVLLMIAFSLMLYGWLLSGKYANLQIMLLVGIILGAGLGSISSFMQRLLTPSEFDVLAARLFGNMSNADVSYLPVAIPLVVVAATVLWVRSKRLNILALGRDTTMTLGLNHRRETILVLFLVSILMAVSTSLVGPMTFLGFLVATLAYQFTNTHDHKYIFPISILTAFTVLTGAYFIMKHIFYAQGVVSIIIELVGGTVFLLVILRKGRL